MAPKGHAGLSVHCLRGLWRNRQTDLTVSPSATGTVFAHRGLGPYTCCKHCDGYRSLPSGLPGWRPLLARLRPAGWQFSTPLLAAVLAWALAVLSAVPPVQLASLLVVAPQWRLGVALAWPLAVPRLDVVPAWLLVAVPAWLQLPAVVRARFVAVPAGPLAVVALAWPLAVVLAWLLAVAFAWPAVAPAVPAGLLAVAVLAWPLVVVLAWPLAVVSTGPRCPCFPLLPPRPWA